jgi:hypothetical protein
MDGGVSVRLSKPSPVAARKASTSRRTVRLQVGLQPHGRVHDQRNTGNSRQLLRGPGKRTAPQADPDVPRLPAVSGGFFAPACATLSRSTPRPESIFAPLPSAASAEVDRAAGTIAVGPTLRPGLPLSPARRRPPRLAVGALLCGLACLCGWSCNDCEPPLVPGAFVDQPQGAGCTSAAECAQGLACVSSLCTTPCSSDADCREDSSCLWNACLLSCAAGGDAVCNAGATSGECLTFSGHQPVCLPRMCFGDASDRMCPAGYRCVGEYRWTGPTGGAGGVGGPYCPTTGWCQKVPGG